MPKLKTKILSSLLFIYLLCPKILFAVQEEMDSQQLSMVVDLARKNKFNLSKKILASLPHEKSDIKWQTRLDFVKGFFALTQNDFATCLKSFNNVLEKEYILADYGTYFLAQCYAKSGENEKALLLLENIISSYPNTTLIPEISLEIARYKLITGNLVSALEELNIFTKKFSNHSKIPEAYFLKGSILEELGQKKAAYESYEYIYYLRPEDPIADSALQKMITISLDNLLEIGIPDLKLMTKRAHILVKKKKYNYAIEDLDEIIAIMESGKEQEELLIKLSISYIKTGQNDKAIETLSAHIKNYPSGVNTPEAIYMLGNIFWNKDNPEKALQTMDSLIKTFPESKWALKAAFISARILEEDGGKKDKALEAYGNLVKSVKRGELKEASLWRLGWIYYKEREYQKTIDLFSETVSSIPEAASKDRFFYWIGKGAEQIGDMNLAISNYEKLSGFPFSFYSVLGHERIKNLKEVTLEAREKQSIIPEDLEAKGNLYGFEKDLDDLLNESDKKNEHGIKKALELIETGFYTEADKEITSSKKLFNESISKKMLLSVLYQKAKKYNKAFRIRDTILSSIPTHEREKIEPEFWYNFYPLSYWKTLSALSEKNGVDPFLVLSLIRQESAYDPEAISVASARGLMQIMANTGEKLYKELDIKKEFNEEILFDPEINLTLGIYYLKKLINKYDSNLILAIANYNAGPTAVKKWIERNKNIPSDEFIENISYPETREYIKAVLRNYENYKKIYLNY